MNKIFVTGDIHLNVDIKKLSYKNWPQSRELDRTDTLIICGDAGLTWADDNEVKYWCDWLEDKPYTTVCALGNHENYDILRAIPAEEWNGAIVRRVRPHVMYIENGEILTLNNTTFFFQGGAHSVDKAYRKEGKSWWPQEIPSYQEFQHAAANLKKYNDKVDYIISHTGPNSIVHHLFPYEDATDPVTNFLEKYVDDCVEFERWFLGHFHIDRSYINQKYNILYNDIIELLPNNEIKVINN